jgi:uncharacterized membrane protein YesL
MNKSFWEIFKQSFITTLFLGIIFISGMVFMNLIYEHPYDRCVKMYTDMEDISECVWLLTND